MDCTNNYMPLPDKKKKVAGCYSPRESKKLIQEIKEYPNDLRCIGRSITILEHCALLGLPKDYAQPAETVFHQKREAAMFALELWEKLKAEKHLRLLYLLHKAQNAFLSGKWNMALVQYQMLLKESCILDWARVKVFKENQEEYAGQLELAIQIVHNICLIYVLCGRKELAEQFTLQYEPVLALQRQYYEKQAGTAKACGKDSWMRFYEGRRQTLCNFDTHCLFFVDYTVLHAAEEEHATGSSILQRLYQDCKENHKEYKPDPMKEGLALVKCTERQYLLLEDPCRHSYRGDEERFVIRLINDASLMLENSGSAQFGKQSEMETGVLKELQSLTGLSAVKQEVTSIYNLLKIGKLREEQGLPRLPMSHHLVFTGKPGTGKTTVARLMARIYHELGVVSGGQLIEAKRVDLVATHVGQTAVKTQAIIKKAIGGVLFIDEAYTLVNESASDFGQEAIDTLLTAMEDYRENLVVIVAGYPEEMDSFLESNPGLRSRFNKFIHFEDYTPAELLAIFEGMCQTACFELEEQARRTALSYFEKLYQSRDKTFSNGRVARNFFERTVTCQANRLANMANLDAKDVVLLTEADVYGSI